MKKDIFNGKVPEHNIKNVKFHLIFSAAITLVLGIVLLVFSQALPNIEQQARRITGIIAVITLLYAVVSPIVSVKLIRNYPESKGMLKLFFNVEVIERASGFDRTGKTGRGGNGGNEAEK